MKLARFRLLLIPLLLPLLAACGGKYDYSRHISETRSDLFLASSEEFSLTLACITRERPYASDGVACPSVSYAEIVLTSETAGGEYSVFVGEDWGGEMSYRSLTGDWYFSRDLAEFPRNTVSIRVERDGKTWELAATSVKNEDTMSVSEALEIALEHEKEQIKRLTNGGVFHGEFRVRLLRRDVNYYYVGIIGQDGRTISLLLGAESGKVLARRES